MRRWPRQLPRGLQRHPECRVAPGVDRGGAAGGGAHRLGVREAAAEHGGAALARPFAYSRAEFERRIESLYYFQAEQTQKLQLDLCDPGLRQLHIAFAPFALVDGCWLRYAGAAELSRGVKARLFSIFADEVGNGRYEANHANIYRRLLADMGFEFAEAWHDAFAQDPRIPEQAYKVPSFLLAVGVCAQQYYPRPWASTWRSRCRASTASTRR